MQQFVGIDWATRRARWCAVTPAGVVIDEGWAPADEDGLAGLVMRLGPEALACMEMMSGAAWVRERLQGLAAELERSHPGAAAWLREGLEETLTVTRLGVRGALRKTLQSTNPCESMIETVRRTARNVKRWQNGDMCLY